VIAVVGWGVAVGFAGLAPSLGLMVLLLAVGGAADLVSAVYRQSILQTYAPDRLRGRLQGVFTVVVAGGPRLGDLRAGATAALTGATASWTGGGFVAAGLTVVLATAFPALVRYRPPEEEPGTG
jgi:sugar phosphate permease